jgi:membrane associated rhomboid family serine protease
MVALIYSYFIHIGFLHLAAKLFLALAYVGFILESFKRIGFYPFISFCGPVCQSD